MAAFMMAGVYSYSSRTKEIMTGNELTLEVNYLLTGHLVYVSIN
ncbi:hypothetical protein SDC9_94225 [bioreactor metagenome]|uniref:Uncharacterized protein n=1 Tax=bioreactor metagenome TaxID=1076179 RepID=A0A645ACW0_9ZZZZ